MGNFSKRVCKFVLSLSLVAAMFGCKGDDKAKHDLNGAVHVFSETTYPMPDCLLFDSSKYKYVIRVLFETLDPAVASRKVSYSGSQGSENAEESEDVNMSSENSNNSNSPDYKEPYNIDFTSIDQNKAPIKSGDIVMIRVFLPKRSMYHFYNVNGIKGIGLGLSSNAFGMCGADIKPGSGSDKREVAYFFMPYAPYATGSSFHESTFNFGLTYEGLTASFFVDPKMKEPG